MSHTSKNYGTSNGDKIVVNGELAIVGTGKLTKNGLEIKPAATQANSVATDAAGLVTDFNALLTKLKAAGLML